MAARQVQESQGRQRSEMPADPRGEEDRVRDSMERCYDEGICPDDLDLGEVVEDEQGKRYVVNGVVDEIKKQWLKEHTVILIYQDEAKKLSRAVKEDLIRANEDGWMTQRRFNPEVKRGRISFEGANVVSYVANASEVAQWLINQGEIKLRLADEEYITICKPWMTRNELKELRLREPSTNFWIMALRVPMDAYFYLNSAVRGMFGEVLHVHPPEYDRSGLKLMNVKIDMDPNARYEVEDKLWIEGSAGERWKVDIATPYTDYCRKCRCERQGANGMGIRRRVGAWRRWREEESWDVGGRSMREERGITGRLGGTGGMDELGQGTGRWGDWAQREEEALRWTEQSRARPEGVRERSLQPNMANTTTSSQSRIKMGSEWLGEDSADERGERSGSAVKMERSADSSANSRKQMEGRTTSVARSMRDRRADTAHRSQVEVVKRCLVPLLCTMANDGIYFLAVAGADGQPRISAEVIECSPTPTLIMERTKNMYENHVPIWIIPRSSMISIFCETQDGFFKCYFPLLDARIPPETAELLTQSGIRWYHMSTVGKRNMHKLQDINIIPGITGAILLNLSEKLDEEEGLQSNFMVNSLTKEWGEGSRVSSSRCSSRGSSRSNNRTAPGRSEEDGKSQPATVCIQQQAEDIIADG
ncbi:hypothetical protein CBR_g34172 [Chara braunii]|uniref:Uncharacterized protein n=1 Tax=Chara braunii TaxID=69332 RepID=A0A388LIF6_CHABU|nr:hypothetical protein CBR_g34172 [Chara braunii]|eukprot:GBG81992.1 hypothetical protein CBR_g34172 [Chara braunii]